MPRANGRATSGAVRRRRDNGFSARNSPNTDVQKTAQDQAEKKNNQRRHAATLPHKAKGYKRSAKAMLRVERRRPAARCASCPRTLWRFPHRAEVKQIPRLNARPGRAMARDDQGRLSRAKLCGRFLRCRSRVARTRGGGDLNMARIRLSSQDCRHVFTGTVHSPL